jgi:hypothetical protein
MPDVTFTSTYNLVKNKKNNSDQRILLYLFDKNRIYKFIGINS